MDYFDNLPSNQKLILLVILIVVVAMTFKTSIMVSAPYLAIAVLTGWVGYNVYSGPSPNQHTCQKVVMIKKEPVCEGFMPEDVLDDTVTRPANQQDDVSPDYKNIKLHGDENQAKSYAVAGVLKPRPLNEDRSITNYPFKMMEDGNGDIRSVYTQDDATDDILTDEKDQEVYDLYHNKGCSGDTMIASRMSHMATMPKRAIEARARLDKYTIAPYLEEELGQHANSRWWDNEDLEHMF